MNYQKLADIIESIFETHCNDEELSNAAHRIIAAQSLNSGDVETLFGMHKNGPLVDGDVCSKASRDTLLEMGYCAKVVVKGEDGFNACTYLGREALRIVGLAV